MNKKNVRLSDTDWKLLNALWDRPPQTMGQIVQSVREESHVKWSYKTYFTYLRALCQKGFIGYEIRNAKADRLYYPLISREAAIEMESENVLNRISGGQLQKLIASIARSGRISERDKEKLLKLYDELESEEKQKE